MHRGFTPVYYETRSAPRQHQPYPFSSAAHQPTKYVPVFMSAPKPAARSFSFTSFMTPQRPKEKRAKRPATSAGKERIFVSVDEFDPAYFERSPRFTPPPPPYHETQRASYAEERRPRSQPQLQSQSRARAASTPQPPKRKPSTREKPKSKSKPKRVATPADAARANIPAGYSLKFWDPSMDPIVLLGSVFDANSLGKWVYDWTVYHHGAGSPMADAAGDLWLSLIEVASKMRRADAAVDGVKRRRRRELLEDFLDEGDALFERLRRILRRCEQYMWDAAGAAGAAGAAPLGPQSGCAFVDTMFGRDRELPATEALVAEMRHWVHRFCSLGEEILRRPRD